MVRSFPVAHSLPIKSRVPKHSESIKMASLEKFRQELDTIDAQLLAALGKRFQVIRQVAEFKKQQSIPMMQPARVKAVQQSRQELGRQHGLDSDFVSQLYTLIIQEACRVEDEIIDATTQSPQSNL